MSSNIYEDVSCPTAARYNKRENGGERIERLVDIYVSCDSSADPRVYPSVQDRGARPQRHRPAVQRNPFKAVGVFLLLLCVLLLVGITVLYIFYEAAVLKEKELKKKLEDQSIKLEEQQKNISHLTKLSENSFCNLGKDIQMHTQQPEHLIDKKPFLEEWKKFQCYCYYTSTEMKNWTESREDCRWRSADLVVINNPEKQEFVRGLERRGDSWIGLETVQTKDWNIEWKWVDGSKYEYRGWAVDVKLNHKAESKAYVNPTGAWMYSRNGLKYWICERKMC